VPNYQLWLDKILEQFPIVFVIGLAIWYAEKRVREKELRLEARFDEQLKRANEREDKIRKEIREDRDAEINRFLESQKVLKESNEKLLAAKDEQITNLTHEVEKFRKELASLTKKMSG
jgi:phage shock protein A